MQGPLDLISHLSEHNYHPRSDAHSNAICRGILGDLITHCELIRERARQGRLVANLNHFAVVNHQRWNIDLALGEPPEAAVPLTDAIIAWQPPSTIQIAIEAKGVMTEHGKARHNRLRDLQAFHSHAHAYDQRVVAVGIVVVNISRHFWSPTRGPGVVSEHRNIDRVGAETVALYRNLPIRSDQASAGLDAAAVVVVDHDNMASSAGLPDDAPRSQTTRLIERPPAPPVGDPLNYSAMVRRICSAYRHRWG
jgi:hypothetical protein